MAEFCIDCENKMGAGTFEPIHPGNVVTDWDYCEGCGRWTQCIVCYEPWYHGPRRLDETRPDGPSLSALVDNLRRRWKERGRGR